MEKYNINKCIISRWERMFGRIKEGYDLNKKRLEGGGRKSTFETYEHDIILYILFIKRSGYGLNMRSIAAYIYALDDEFRGIDYDIMRQRIHRLLVRYHLL